MMTTPPPSIIGALAKALPELEAAKKTKNNPAFKSKYADLGAVIDALEPLRSHGIWFRQVQIDNENGVLIETLYIHESGQELSAGKTFVPASKRDAQGYGSAMSYARRYGLQSAFGLATEDDDGNAASASMNKRGARQEASGNDNHITPSQVVELQKLAGEVKADLAKFCKYLQVDALPQLPAGKFEAAKKALEAKRQKGDAQ